jgi:hypothetical protein
MIEYLLYALIALVAILLIIIRDAITVDGAKAKAAIQNVGARVSALFKRSA